MGMQAITDANFQTGTEKESAALNPEFILQYYMQMVFKSESGLWKFECSVWL